MPPKPFPFEGDAADLYDVQHVDVRWPAEWKAKAGWRPYNPSLAWVDGQLFCSVRYSFFAFPGIDKTGQTLVSSNYYGRSETILARLNADTLQVEQWQKLTYLDWVGSRNSGLEDVRLFTRDGDLFGIGVFLPLGDGEPCQAIVSIDPNEWTARLVEVFHSDTPEKNWSPVEGRQDFTYSPTETVNAGTVDGKPYSGVLHGGTQLIQYGDGYLSVVHHSVSRRLHARGGRNRNVGRHYVHHWALWDADVRLTHLTAPFVFKWESSIEFASGLVRHGDRLLVSWGWGDYDLTLSTFDIEAVAAQLKPYRSEQGFLIGRTR